VSAEDIEVVRRQFAATNEGAFERAMDLYAEDVVLIAPRVEGIQNPGTYEGKAAVGEWFGDWFRTFAPGYHFEIDETSDLGGGVVYLHATHGGKGRLSGAEVHGETTYLYRVSDGKIDQVGFYVTREQAIEAAASPEWSTGQTD